MIALDPHEAADEEKSSSPGLVEVSRCWRDDRYEPLSVKHIAAKEAREERELTSLMRGGGTRWSMEEREEEAAVVVVQQLLASLVTS